MKLLLDENLSRRVIPFILEAYPVKRPCSMKARRVLWLLTFDWKYLIF
jgi:hypothetical protein